MISPGSRNAPIVAGFLRIDGFELLSAPDERSAAFMALGCAQSTGKACAVICTSGTAVLNLYPGICEAYYQQVPLIAITADRPEMMIDRWDGQTIRQNGIFEKHILQSFHLAADIHTKEAQLEIGDIAKNAWKTAHGSTHGPVHINIALSEPIYEGIENTAFDFAQLPVEDVISEPRTYFDFNKLAGNKNILVVAGQGFPDEKLKIALNKVGKKLPVLADVLSNVHGENTISATENKGLFTGISAPDILFTTGMSLVSKPLKEWLRKQKPFKHYHISLSGFVGDPFFSDPVHIPYNPADFFIKLNSALDELQIADYKAGWNYNETENDAETKLVFDILEAVDDGDVVHLGNSMTVRQANKYNNLKGLFYGNRGTSGIDGSVSTACGFAWGCTKKRVICISGDMGFLYDKNAFWCNPLPGNLKVIVINNGMGRIFDKIEGPGKLPALRPFIQTPHDLSAEHIAMHYGLDYYFVRHDGDVKQKIKEFFHLSGTGILEIFA